MLGNGYKTTLFLNFIIGIGGLFAASETPSVPDDVQFPTIQVVPPPTPSVDPNSVIKLLPDELYVVNSKIKGYVTTSPQGYVTVTKEATPFNIKSKFVDSKGQSVRRSYTGEVIYSIEAIPGKVGTIEIIFIPETSKIEKDLVKYRRTVEVNPGVLPIPPPTPKPDPKPDPIPTPVEPPPIGGTGFKVLFVYESENLPKMARDKPKQHSILFADEIRAYLDAKCPVGENGRQPDYRFFDKDATSAPNYKDSKIWVDAMKRPRTGEPWVIISNGKSKSGSYEGPLPEDVPSMMTLLKRYMEPETVKGGVR